MSPNEFFWEPVQIWIRIFIKKVTISSPFSLSFFFIKARLTCKFRDVISIALGKFVGFDTSEGANSADVSKGMNLTYLSLVFESFWILCRPVHVPPKLKRLSPTAKEKLETRKPWGFRIKLWVKLVTPTIWNLPRHVWRGRCGPDSVHFHQKSVS